MFLRCAINSHVFSDYGYPSYLIRYLTCWLNLSESSILSTSYSSVPSYSTLSVTRGMFLLVSSRRLTWTIGCILDFRGILTLYTS